MLVRTHLGWSVCTAFISEQENGLHNLNLFEICPCTSMIWSEIMANLN